MEKGTKKKIAIGVGVLALAFVGFKFMGGKGKSSSGMDRMRADANNPSTPIGREFKGYYESRGIYNQESIESGIAFHSNPANNSPYYAQYFG